MTIPLVPFHLDVAPDFQRPARYALAMLGAVAGFRPRFVAADEAAGALRYGYPAAGSAGGPQLPASREAHALLVSRTALPDGAARIGEWDGQPLPLLFPVTDVDPPELVPGLPAFDLVAAAYFFLSLHEQWTGGGRDAHGRFRAADSLLGRAGLLDVPVVARYARLLAALLRAAGVALPGRAAEPPVVCLTHDVDHVTKRRPGMLRRELAHLLLARGGRPFAERLRRFREYLGFFRAGRDPYRVSLERMLAAECMAGLRATWFIKAGRSDRRDAPVYLRTPWFPGVLAEMAAAGHERGLHASYNVVEDEAALRREAGALQRATGDAPRSLRQHYLRFRHPATWRAQARCGIAADSTLGFAEREGFRNGCCHPFLAFDPERREALPLWELPLAVMDGTLQDYRGMDAEAGERRILELYRAARAEGGVFTVLFHNSCWDEHDFPGWDGVFLRFLDELQDSGALCMTISETAEWWLRRAGYRDTAELLETVNGGR